MFTLLTSEKRNVLLNLKKQMCFWICKSICVFKRGAFHSKKSIQSLRIFLRIFPDFFANFFNEIVMELFYFSGLFLIFPDFSSYSSGLLRIFCTCGFFADFYSLRSNFTGFLGFQNFFSLLWFFGKVYGIF